MKQKLILIASLLILIFAFAPWANAQWVQANGISGGRGVTCFATIDTTLFVGTWDLGVFRSTDYGINCISSGAGLPAQIEINTLTTIGTELIEGSQYEGVFLSSNNGSSWFARNSGLPYNSVAGYPYILAFAQVGPYLFAGGDSLYLSTNGGTNWSRDSSLPNFQAFVQIGTNLFIGTQNNGVFHSTDNGISWMAADTGLPPQTRVLAFVVIGTDIFASIHSEFNGINGIFRSTDLGATWSSVSNGLTNKVSPSLVASGSNLFEGEDSVFLSTDSGASWKPVNTGLISSNNIQSLGVSGGNLLAGTLGTLWVRPLSQMVSTSAVSEAATALPAIQNYPNPFSSSTTINITVYENGMATVSVVNTLGTEVARIYSGALSAGAHSFQWNASGLPAGMYECVVQMNGGVQRVPMVVVRN